MRQIRKQLRANLYTQNPALMAAELADQRDILEYRLQISKGDKGDRGERGETGPMGPRGYTGERGNKGDKGEQGKNGKDGVNGKNGRDGRDGKDGENAFFDPQPLYKKVEEIRAQLLNKLITVDDVLEAISNLTGDKRIDAKNIKNLPTVYPSTQAKKKIDFSDMRWHGGGLSASGIYTETPVGAVNGINTTYTVSRTINNVIGFAINGEYIHPSDYTFSGGTITFLVALPGALSGLPFSITYV